jgi:hypothetical protein
MRRKGRRLRKPIKITKQQANRICLVISKLLIGIVGLQVITDHFQQRVPGRPYLLPPGTRGAHHQKGADDQKNGPDFHIRDLKPPELNGKCFGQNAAMIDW